MFPPVAVGNSVSYCTVYRTFYRGNDIAYHRQPIELRVPYRTVFKYCEIAMTF